MSGWRNFAIYKGTHSRKIRIIMEKLSAFFRSSHLP